MLLAIDVGNTNIVLGIFEGSNLVASWRLATDHGKTSDELGIVTTELLRHRGIDPNGIDGIVMASVVPPLTTTMIAMAIRYFGRTPVNVEGVANIGMPIRYDAPAEVGADRLVNAIAAFERYGRPTGRPVIVVDFGTATTFDAISEKGEYLGGAICPGVSISAEALFEHAARLPLVDVRRPPSIIGRTTVTSMQAGLFYGYVGLVEGIVRRMRHELGEGAACIATGGLAEMIAPETSLIEAVEPDLTLLGLRLVWERNQWRA
jgi:type III pantothenate kinase